MNKINKINMSTQNNPSLHCYHPTAELSPFLTARRHERAGRLQTRCNMQHAICHAMPCTPQKESYRTLYVRVPRGYTARLPPASLLFPKFQVPASSVDNNHSISRAPSLPTLLYFSRQRVERVDSSRLPFRLPRRISESILLMQSAARLQ